MTRIRRPAVPSLPPPIRAGWLAAGLRMLGLSILGLSMVGLSVGAIPGGSAAAQPSVDDDPTRFAGSWALVPSMEEAEQIVDRAAERAASAMNFFIRGIARSRLRDGTSVNRRIDLAFSEPDRVTVRFSAEGDSYTTQLGRTVRRRSSDGEDLRVTQRLRPGGALEQVFEADGGTRWYVYELLDADRMRVEVSTDSPQMPQPMRFALDYRRLSRAPQNAPRR